VPAPPDGAAAPTTPDELRKTLLARLGEARRGKVDMVVVEGGRFEPAVRFNPLSRPPSTQNPSQKTDGSAFAR
jgi:hypothetical protein